MPENSFILCAFLGIALLMLLAGYLAGRGQDDEGYNIYSRSLPSLGYIVSYAATFIGAGFFVTGTAYVYLYGLAFAWFFIGMVFGVAVFGCFAYWLRKNTADAGLYTLPDFYRWRFGASAARVLSLITLLLLAGDMSIQLIAGGKLLEVMGVMPYQFSILLTVAIVAIYLLWSGFRAVVWTDYLLLAAIIILTVFMSLVSLPEIRISAFNWSLNDMPAGFILGFFLFGLFGPFSIATYYQRVLAARSPEVARKSTWLSGALILLPGACLFLIGGAARSSFPGIDPDTTFLQVVRRGGLPLLLSGSVILWAALISTLDTLAFAGGQILNRELLGLPLSRRNVGRSILLLLAVALLISSCFPSITQIAMMFLGGGLIIAPSAFCQWFVKDLREKAAIASLLTGTAALFVWALSRGITPEIVLVSFLSSSLGLFAGQLCFKGTRVS